MDEWESTVRNSSPCGVVTRTDLLMEREMVKEVTASPSLMNLSSASASGIWGSSGEDIFQHTFLE
jgi:hypothetical protein